jgi:hypothetical protein
MSDALCIGFRCHIVANSIIPRDLPEYLPRLKFFMLSRRILGPEFCLVTYAYQREGERNLRDLARRDRLLYEPRVFSDGWVPPIALRVDGARRPWLVVVPPFAISR